jgi:hypothetical protein
MMIRSLLHRLLRMFNRGGAARGGRAARRPARRTHGTTGGLLRRLLR